jgi:hypothetical protein
MNMLLRVQDVPATETVFSFIRKSTRYPRACGEVGLRLRTTPIIELELADVSKGPHKQSIVDIVDDQGVRECRGVPGARPKCRSIPLTCNPDVRDEGGPQAGSFATRYPLSELSCNATGAHEPRKNSHLDTYGFRVRAPVAKTGYLGGFLNSFSRSLVRSWIAIVAGENADPESWTYDNESWHRNDPVFEHLRINVPIQMDEEFIVELKGEEPRHLEVGTAYTWDTNRPYRLFTRRPTKRAGIYLVVGLSPWFDYDVDNDGWAPNVHFGRQHPFDMVAEGIVNRQIGIRRRRIA